MLASWKESYDQPRQHIKKQRHNFANKVPSSQTMIFPVVMYGYESWTIKEGWTLKNCILYTYGAGSLPAELLEKLLAPWKKSCDQPRQNNKKQRHFFANKGPSSQGYGFSTSHLWMWELDYKESWAPKNWCFWTVVLEKTLESSLDFKEIKPIYPKGNQSWIFIGKADAEAEAAILWPPDVKNWLIGKDPDAGQDWRQEDKGMTEDEMIGWHHQLNGHEFE